MKTHRASRVECREPERLPTAEDSGVRPSPLDPSNSHFGRRPGQRSVWSPAFRRFPAADRLKPGLQTRQNENCCLNPRCHARRGFTLIEMMVVVAIIGIVMTIAIPGIYRRLHPESMQKAVSDIMEACSHARAHAVLNGRPMDMVIHAGDGQITVQPAPGAGPPARSDAGVDVVQHRNRGVDYAEFRKPAGGGGGGGVFTARLSDSIAVEAAEINFMDIMDMDEARVRFFPNGTCYEFKIILFQPKTGERRMLTLEVTTGLADVESDPHKFK